MFAFELLLLHKQLSPPPLHMLLVTVSELQKQLRSNFAVWHLSALATICGRLHQFNDPPCPCVRSHTRSARHRGCLAVSQQAQEAKNLCTDVALIADVQSVCSHCLLGRLVMPDCHDAMRMLFLLMNAVLVVVQLYSRRLFLVGETSMPLSGMMQ